MKISIIGSFQKYYEEIKQTIILFIKNHIEVLSPKVSVITHSIEDFVIFASDNQELTPPEIQTDTLNRILKSDIVYVYNPKGYIGRTTCYEIGVIRTTTIPLFFLEHPNDLPILVHDCEIMNPSKLIYSLLNDKRFISKTNRIVIDKNKIKSSMRSKKIVICGSMVFYDKMLEISEYLKKEGISVVIPKEETERDVLSEEKFSEFKRKVSSQYLSKIRDSSTYAILVLNQEKKCIANYIGANTLVEISMAFSWRRSIYLFNDFYEPLMDELIAWNSICLKGNLDKLIDDYKKDRYLLIEKKIVSDNESQLELGDINEYFYPLFR